MSKIDPCPKHGKLTPDCPHCTALRAFLERQVLNGALQFVAAGRHYKGITLPGQMLDYFSALNSAVRELNKLEDR